MSKCKKKYNKLKENDAETLMCPTYSYGLGETSPVCAVPDEIAIRSDDTGFILGKDYYSDPPCYVGIPKGAEGNIAVIGGNGSGKSACIAKPTLLKWKGPMCVTDIKGELSKYYAEHCNVGKYRSYRPYIVFDPTNPNGYSYDPFEILRRCDENGSDFICYIKEMALIISPRNNDEKYKYWEDAERRILTGMLIHHFKLGLSFSETICRILISNISSICEEIKDHGDTLSNSYIGMIDDLSRKEIFEFDTGLRNKLTGFYDDRIQHFFRGKREGAKCLWWNDLDRYDIFIRIPENRVDIWGNAINLMYSQLIHYLESRPEKYSEEGANTEPVLLLMDEFPRFGKLNSIIPAITTLRSKNVNICLMLQSIAQLDMIYGQDCRRVIFDNCQYKAILNASDAETQRELSELIGTDRVLQSSISHTYNNDFKIVGSSIQNSCIRKARVPPHELSALKDVIALTPYGNYCISKIIPSDEERDFEDYKEYLSKYR